MNPRRFDSETMVSRAATDGPGSSTEVVGLSAVTVVSSGTGGGTSCDRLLGQLALKRLGGRAIECLGLNSRTSRAQPAAIRVCRQFDGKTAAANIYLYRPGELRAPVRCWKRLKPVSGRGNTRAAMPGRRVR